MIMDDDDMRYFSNSLSNKAACEKAAILDLEVVIPDEYTLSVDIDSPILPGYLTHRLDKIGEHYEIVHRTITESQNGNFHYYVKLKTPMTVMERIALQAILGSDPIKELLSFVRAKEGDLGEPTLMFEKKEWVKELEAFAKG